MAVSEPTKETDGDPLFTASLNWGGPRTVDIGERIILDRNQPKCSEDPCFQRLTKSLTWSTDSASRCHALHNYYSEFRLGHGDPLLKAAMRNWPHTTTEYSSPDPPCKSKSVPAGSCTTLFDPSSVTFKLPISDVALLQD
jgi:hypothetical protein